MLITLIPLFDKNMTVSAYSLFSQKKNHLQHPNLLGTGANDGASYIPGLEVIQQIGMEILTGNREVFVPLNNISVFTDISSQHDFSHKHLVLLFDNSIRPEEMYIKRIKELKDMGYKLAIRKLTVQDLEPYKEILKLMDYIILDHKKINIKNAKILFKKLYPDLKLVAGNIETNDIFQALTEDGGYQLFEGEFFRVPITKGQHEVSPLKANYIQLMNSVNSDDFDLAKTADVIGQDTALVISLLKMVNRMTINSEISSIRHAAAMLGQRELRKWINAVAANELYADKPNEITRLSLIRAKFAENLASVFGLAVQSSELFLMGLFSVLDVILEMPMEEALKVVKTPKEVSSALIYNSGQLAPVLDFVLQYETANWQEVSRVMILQDIEMTKIYDAYVQTLQWYKEVVIG